MDFDGMTTRHGRQDNRPGTPLINAEESLARLKQSLGDFYERVIACMAQPNYLGEISLSIKLYDSVPQECTVMESSREKYKDVAK